MPRFNNTYRVKSKTYLYEQQKKNIDKYYENQKAKCIKQIKCRHCKVYEKNTKLQRLNYTI